MRFRGVFVIVFALFLVFSGEANATVKDKSIENVAGLGFENIVYSWNKVILDVVNTTPNNITFGGTMIFLDRRGKPIAKASLLPKKVPALKTERYTAYLIEGTGEMARRATRVIWEFGAR